MRARSDAGPTGAGVAAGPARVDVDDLRGRVRDVYREVAERPDGEFHFATGRELAERLGYDPAALDRVPEEALRSFAGVGHAFDLAAIREGERVLDLGSGSGTDVFVAAGAVGPRGRVVGVDMTLQQLEKAEALRARHGHGNVSFVEGYLEELPVEDASFDVVISNGVINLVADKAATFREVARALKPGGRLAMSDIVSETRLSDDIVCDSALWASCIGGAEQQDAYRAAIEAAGLRLEVVRDNPAYRFLSASARGASRRYGVKSVSLLARREGA